MLYDKKTKALFYEGKEKIEDVLNGEQLDDLSRFLEVYFSKILEYSNKIAELRHQFYMHFGNDNPQSVFKKLSYDIPLRKLYLLIEIFSKFQFDIYRGYRFDYFKSFVHDINNFFMIEKIPLQLIYVKGSHDIFMEKIIDDVHSEKVKETLIAFSEYKKIHEDFKQAIVSYSSGDYPKSIEKCCIAIEDYLCVILGKETCPSIESYYNDASKKLKIPDDISVRFKPMISFIHSYRSKPLHGSTKSFNPENPHLIAQIVIGFTMTILNYLYHVFEQT